LPDAATQPIVEGKAAPLSIAKRDKGRWDHLGEFPSIDLNGLDSCPFTRTEKETEVTHLMIRLTKLSAKPNFNIIPYR
jgi:hypothetical protein